MTTDSKAVCGGGEIPNTDDADWTTVLAVVRLCARSWVPEARLVGNVRAGDIARACDAALASTAGAGAGDWVTVHKLIAAAHGVDPTAPSEAQIERLHRAADTLHRVISSAVPASPRTGAGKGEEADDHAEELRQPQPVKVVARLLRKHDGTARVRARHYDMARQILSALAQGGGAGRSEKGEGEDEGRRAIRFAMGLEDHWDRFEFLNAFIGGDLSEWPEFTKPEPAPAQSPSTSDAEG